MQGVPTGTHTTIHQFDISKPDVTTYVASGGVSGVLLNQFAMSEHDGHLRVASTDTPVFATGFAPPPRGGETDNLVSVLDRRGGSLTTVGKVDGIGRGERIFAVRFIGDAGFVVTFKRIDPLFSIDLSDPAHPKVVGELTLLGYSAYLHPVGSHLLLGLGRSGTAQGSVGGVKLSLFDISDLSKPRLLGGHEISSASSSSDAESDHHAFLYWPRTGLAVIPVTSQGFDGTERFMGAIGLDVNPSGAITEVGRVADKSDGWFRPIGRSLVMGDRLLALSDEALLANRLDTLAPLARVPFGIKHDPPPPYYYGPVAIP
jgi:uncharacterized secreted protein with C-terminal beta-propeller domain